jgi:hypothetical protein
MSIENNQEKLIVSAEIGSTTPIESNTEILSETIPSVPSVPQESVSSTQVTQEEGKSSSKKDSSEGIAITGARDGVGWFALIDRKEEGGEIEVL